MPATLRMTLALVAALAMISGCAFTPAELALQPRIPTTASHVGAGTTLGFTFTDERDDVTVGHRHVATFGAKISAEQLPAVFDAELRRILSAKGYRLVDAGERPDAAVTYRLRSFKFTIEAGFFTGGRNAAAALAVDARRQDRTYTKVYRANSEQRILVVPMESEINQQMNAALNEILAQAAADTDLDLFLTSR